MQTSAILIDIISIQDYIFSSNKLKENLGASYIIENVIFNEILIDTIKIILNVPKFPENHWKSDSQKEFPDSFSIGIGYIGGGNALVLINNQDNNSEVTPEKLINLFTLKLLAEFPGLITAITIDKTFETEAPDFTIKRKLLAYDLSRNKSLITAITTPFKHGIVSDCPLSNEAQEVYNVKQGWISLKSNIKLINATLANEKAIKDFIPIEYQCKYTFTTELDKLGQPEDKSYIAIIHVDGNGLGQKFANCKNLKNLRELSMKVSIIANRCMHKLVKKIIELLEDPDKLSEENNFKLKVDSEKRILPLRPIITGGDDITFVCDGRLGVYLAEFFIQIFREESHCEFKKEISACAGVAIVGTKYPFYRAYKLSAKLCDEAKESSRDKNDSWLSFYISTSGFSGEISEIRNKQEISPQGYSLSMNPYCLDDVPNLQNTVHKLKTGISKLTNTTLWPRNKIKELRDVLRSDESAINYFILGLKSRNIELPGDNKFHNSLFDLRDESTDKNRTPYFDMVNLCDFYPTKLLNN